MNFYTRISLLFAVTFSSAIATRAVFGVDGSMQPKNPPEALSVEEIQKLLEKLPADEKRKLVDSANSMMTLSYVGRNDDSALTNGRWLLLLHPDRAKDSRQAELIVAELHRRKAKGTFGKTPLEKLPARFDSWPAPQKLTFLIDSLDEIDNSNRPLQLFGPQVGHDWRTEALIGIGDTAVPALIDTIEHDVRLTRSLEPASSRFEVSWKILPVRDAAMDALRAILHVRHFDPAQGEVNLHVEGKENIQRVAAQLRAYWKANSEISLDERMMKVLTNPLASDGACREAAHNLASSQRGCVYGPLGIEIRPSDDSPPAVVKFRNPTVGEAILAVLDRISAGREVKAKDVRTEPNFGHEEADVAYLGPLVDLHDRRLRAEFLRRYKSASTLHKRMVWAVAANASGDAGPVKELANEFHSGRLIIPSDGRSDNVGASDLADLVGCFTRIDLPETSQALFAAADPRHPLHNRLAQKIAATAPWTSPFFGEPYLEHPYCLAFLRHDLDDHTPTGATYQIGATYSSADSLTYGVPGTGTITAIPDFLRNPASRRESAPELVCDRAAALIDAIVFGMPVVNVHPLSKDHDDRLKEMIAQVDHYQGRFRSITSAEHVWIGFDVPLTADIALAGKPATADDVRAGRAIFNLPSASKPAPIKLPAVGTLKQIQPGTGVETVLIVQAEIDGNGKTVYGIIGRRFMRRASADELTNIKEIGPSDHRDVFQRTD